MARNDVFFGHPMLTGCAKIEKQVIPVNSNYSAFTASQFLPKTIITGRVYFEQN